MCLKFFKAMKNKIVEILEKKFQNWRVNHVVRKTSPTPLCQLQKFPSGNLQEHLLGTEERNEIGVHSIPNRMKYTRSWKDD